MKENFHDDLLPEYRLDYRKGKPNRFAKKRAKDKAVVFVKKDDGDSLPLPEPNEDPSLHNNRKKK